MTDIAIPALSRAVHHATEWLNGLSVRSVAATTDLETLRRRLGGPLPEKGLDPVHVIDELAANTEGGHLGCASGRFFAWVIGGALPAALAADWLTSTWDQNAAIYACGPAAAVVEEVVGEWLKDLLDLPSEASFALTTGCQLAHFTCLAAARYAVLKAVGWKLAEDGLFGAPPIRVITTDQRHGSVDRALRFLGFGTRQLTCLPVDTDGRVEPESFRLALGEGSGPTIVVLDAADLNIAAFDPFRTLIPIAQAAGAWVHIDGAFGLIARASPSKRHFLDGVDLADSWATDGHKWLNLPFDSGFAFVRDREAHRASMTVGASYIPAEARSRDQIDWNPEWSRRGRGFTVYSALSELGRQGVAELVDRTCRHASEIVKGIGALHGTRVLWQPHLNQGLVRFLDPAPTATEADHDRWTDAIIAAVNATGETFVGGSIWRGRRAMRISVVNWRTDEGDVRRTVKAVEHVLQVAL